MQTDKLYNYLKWIINDEKVELKKKKKKYVILKIKELDKKFLFISIIY